MVAAADLARKDLAAARAAADAGCFESATASALLAIGELCAGLVDGELASERGLGDEDQDQGAGPDVPGWLREDQAAAAAFAERMRNAPKACIPGQAIHVEVYNQARCECGEVVI